MEVKRQIKGINTDLIFLEFVESLSEWSDKVMRLMDREIWEVELKAKRVEEGSKEYYDKILRKKKIIKPKLPKPEYRIEFPKVFLENQLAMNFGYTFPDLENIIEFIRNFHARKRIYLSRWLISKEPSPNLKEIYILYPVEIMYPSEFWEDFKDKRELERIYFNEPVIRFSNI